MQEFFFLSNSWTLIDEITTPSHLTYYTNKVWQYITFRIVTKAMYPRLRTATDYMTIKIRSAQQDMNSL